MSVLAAISGIADKPFTVEDKEDFKKLVSAVLSRLHRYSFSAARDDTKCDYKRAISDMSRDEGVANAVGLMEPMQDKAPMNVGIATHDFLDLYEKLCYKNGTERDPDGGELICGEIAGKSQLTVNEENDYKILCRSIMWKKSFDVSLQSGAEIEIAFKLVGKKLVICKWKDPDVLVRMKLDRVYIPKTKESLFVFVDYKTNRVAFDESEKEAIQQLRVYACCFFLAFPEYEPPEKVILKYEFCRDSDFNSYVEEFNVRRESKYYISKIMGYCLRMKKRINKAMEDIDRLEPTLDSLTTFLFKFFKPNLNRYCACEWWHICPVYRHTASIIAKDPEDLDPRLLFARQSLVDERKKVTNHMLQKQFKETQAPVDLGPKLYGHALGETVVCDTPKFFQEILSVWEGEVEKGNDPHDVLKDICGSLSSLEIGATAVTKAMKTTGVLKVAMEKSRKVTESKTWKAVDLQKAGNIKWNVVKKEADNG